MASFTYTARTTSGQPVSGTVNAASAGEATQIIRSEGKFPVSIRSADQPLRDTAIVRARGRGIRMSRGDVIHFATQLAIMTETGVTLSEALECIGKQSEKPNVKDLVADVSDQVLAGSSLSDALGRHPRSFPRLFIALIRASEKSGMMARLLNRGTSYLRDEQEILRKVKGALTYPLIMFSFATMTTIFLLTCIMPRFTAIYAMKQAALPTPTRLLMQASDFLVAHWLALLIAAIVGVFGCIMGLRTAVGARIWHYVQLHIPVFGGLYRRLYMARGLRMIGTMAGAGVNLMECVNTAHELCSNTYFRDLWKRVADHIQAGRQLSDPLFESPLVARSVAQMIHSGEKSGKLATVMEQISAFAEQELKDQISSLTRYIEPAMIILMGAIIGSICLALLLPIFTISKVMAQ